GGRMQRALACARLEAAHSARSGIVRNVRLVHRQPEPTSAVAGSQENLFQNEADAGMQGAANDYIPDAAPKRESRERTRSRHGQGRRQQRTGSQSRSSI